MGKSYFKQVLSYALSGMIAATSLFGGVAGAVDTHPENDAQTKAQYEPGVTISEQADEHGLYDVTFTVDVYSLGFDTTTKLAKDVYLYGSFARYPTNVSNWTSTHKDTDESAKMEDWALDPLEADKTINGVIIPEDYADGSDLDGTAPLEQPTYAQEMTAVGDGLYSVTLKLPASPYFYRYAVNPTFTLSTAETVSTSNAILSDRKAYTITADYLSYDPANPSVSNPAGNHIQGKSMIVVGDGGYYHKDDSAPKGTVSFVPYTDVNGNTRYLGVYLPAGYDADGAAYKTLYMSHGGGGEETEWMNKGRVQDVFDYAIANDVIEPTVVITMDNTADYNWDMPTIRKNMMEYIIPFVESHYNVSGNAQDRAMMGLSMGGVTTSYLYMNESRSFGYFAVLSGCTLQDENLYPLSKVSRDAKLLVGAGEEDFGWASRLPSEPGTFTGVKHWMEQLDAAGIEYVEKNVPGTHDWYTWTQLLDYVVSDFLWKGDAAGSSVTISDTADANGLYDVTFTLDTDDLSLTNPVNEVYLYGSFARYPTNVSNWTGTHEDTAEAAKMEDWWLTPLADDKTIDGVIIPDEYADGSHLDDTAPLEQPTYAQKMNDIGDGKYSVTLKLPASPYYYRYAVNPKFTLTADSVVSTGNAILSDKKAYTISADYLSYDPGNPSISNPAGGHVQSKSMIVVGDGAYYHKDDNAAKGRVVFVPYTDVNGNTRYLGVYLPAGYSADGTAYKTLYMSHGMGGEETEWMNKGRVQDIFDYAIANDIIEPTIVVTIDNTADYNWDMPTIRENLMDYVIPYIESHYNVSRDVEDRAMMGLSMGGVTTSYIYMNESDNFGYFAVLSGCTLQDSDAYPLSAVSRDAKLLVGAGEEDFGWGQDPSAPGSFSGVKHWMAELDAAGIDYTEKNVPGTHDWYTWSQLLDYVVSDFLWQDDEQTTSGSGSGGSSTYSVTVPSVSNGTITVNPKNASAGATVTITVQPNAGYEINTLTVTDKNGKSIQLTNLGGNKYTFTMPASSVTIKASFAEAGAVSGLPFTDVASSAWYADAVQYVYDNGIMNGTSSTAFSPEQTTTRGMIVTMLYRMEKEPSAAAADFDDVAANAYYADAIGWASANDIVNGYGDGTFGPDDAIMREQMAAILFRYAAYKNYDVTAQTDLSKYTDASLISSYATDAMQWANAEGLITGNTSTTLDPTGNATRAEVATILMRFSEQVA